MRNPYVTGSYVCGHKHYGRTHLLDSLLNSETHAHWVIGNRRIGKTSLLRQLETLALTSDGLIPVFWDMQGCNTFASLGSYLVDAVQDRLDLFLALGLSRDTLRDENPLTLLPALRRAARAAGRKVLLLCDETEVLINVARAEPELAQRLHGELTRGGGLCVMAASTRAIYQLHEVCRTWPTSPFLAGFDMSHLLGGLDVEHAQALVTQAQATEQVQAAPEVIESICELTNCHPYLLQQLCSRIFQPEGQLRPVEAADLSVDPLLAGFLSNDFNLLSEAEKRLVWTTHEQRQVSEAALAAARHEDVAELQAFLREIVPLGYLRRVDDRLLIGNRFLENWLTAERRRIGQEHFSSAQEGLPPAPLPIATGGRGTGPLVSQLNDKRARLVELEMIRARDLLQVAPEVLAEIRQTEQQIQRLLNVLKGDA